MQWFGSVKNLSWRHIADSLRIDLGYAARQLMRAPMFVIVATLSLAIGTGAMVGAMAMIDMAFFRSMPVPQPDRLFHVYKSNAFGPRTYPYGLANYPDLVEFRQSGAFAELAGSAAATAVFSDATHSPRRQWYEAVSSNYFRTLGLSLYRGRMAVDGSPEIVLAYPFWKSLYASDPSVLGRVLKLNGVEFTIVGIGPENFYGGERYERPALGWLPFESVAHIARMGREALVRGSTSVDLIGRLNPGMTAEAAASRLNPIAASVAMKLDAERAARAKAREAANPGSNASRRSGLDRGSQPPPTITLIRDTRDKVKPGEEAQAWTAVGGITLAVLAILVIACVNVAGLLLARAMARQHEIAVRLALGASRRRLFAQLFSESVVLAVLGGFAGCAAVYVTIRVANTIPEWAVLGVRADWKLVAYALLAGATSSLLFGVMPVLQALRSDLRVGLGATHTASIPAHRARGHIMTAQVAVSCALLIVSFAAVSGTVARLRTEIGFPTSGLLVGTIPPPTLASTDSSAQANHWIEFKRVVAATPGVQSVSFADFVPLDMTSWMPSGIWPNGETGPRVRPVGVDANYFETVRLHATRGRLIDSRDTLGRPAVAVANETYMRAYQKQLGDIVADEMTGERAQIVGVVPDVAHRGPGSPPQPLLYYPSVQRGESAHWRITVRSRDGLEKATALAIEQRLVARFPESIPPDLMTMAQHIRASTKEMRLLAGGSLGIGAVELALASVGLYGILLYNVLARRREIGVRLALGARSSQASWVILWPALKSAARGVVIGAVGGAILLFSMKGEGGLVGAVQNPVPYIAAAIVAGLAAGVAAFAPARRAARVDPATALRYE